MSEEQSVDASVSQRRRVGVADQLPLPFPASYEKAQIASRNVEHVHEMLTNELRSVLFGKTQVPPRTSIASTASTQRAFVPRSYAGRLRTLLQSAQIVLVEDEGRRGENGALRERNVRDEGDNGRVGDANDGVVSGDGGGGGGGGASGGGGGGGSGRGSGGIGGGGARITSRRDIFSLAALGHFDYVPRFREQHTSTSAQHASTRRDATATGAATEGATGANVGAREQAPTRKLTAKEKRMQREQAKAEAARLATEAAHGTGVASATVAASARGSGGGGGDGDAAAASGDRVRVPASTAAHGEWLIAAARAFGAFVESNALLCGYRRRECALCGVVWRDTLNADTRIAAHMRTAHKRTFVMQLRRLSVAAPLLRAPQASSFVLANCVYPQLQRESRFPWPRGDALAAGSGGSLGSGSSGGASSASTAKANDDNGGTVLCYGDVEIDWDFPSAVYLSTHDAALAADDADSPASGVARGKLFGGTSSQTSGTLKKDGKCVAINGDDDEEAEEEAAIDADLLQFLFALMLEFEFDERFAVRDDASQSFDLAEMLKCLKDIHNNVNTEKGVNDDVGNSEQEEGKKKSKKKQNTNNNNSKTMTKNDENDNDDDNEMFSKKDGGNANQNDTAVTRKQKQSKAKNSTQEAARGISRASSQRRGDGCAASATTEAHSFVAYNAVLESELELLKDMLGDADKFAQVRELLIDVSDDEPDDSRHVRAQHAPSMPLRAPHDDAERSVYEGARARVARELLQRRVHTLVASVASSTLADERRRDARERAEREAARRKAARDKAVAEEAAKADEARATAAKARKKAAAARKEAAAALKAEQAAAKRNTLKQAAQEEKARVKAHTEAAAAAAAAADQEQERIAARKAKAEATRIIAADLKANDNVAAQNAAASGKYSAESTSVALSSAVAASFPSPPAASQQSDSDAAVFTTHRVNGSASTPVYGDRSVWQASAFSAQHGSQAARHGGASAASRGGGALRAGAQRRGDYGSVSPHPNMAYTNSAAPPFYTTKVNRGAVFPQAAAAAAAATAAYGSRYARVGGRGALGRGAPPAHARRGIGMPAHWRGSFARTRDTPWQQSSSAAGSSPTLAAASGALAGVSSPALYRASHENVPRGGLSSTTFASTQGAPFAGSGHSSGSSGGGGRGRTFSSPSSAATGPFSPPSSSSSTAATAVSSATSSALWGTSAGATASATASGATTATATAIIDESSPALAVGAEAARQKEQADADNDSRRLWRAQEKWFRQPPPPSQGSARKRKQNSSIKHSLAHVEDAIEAMRNALPQEARDMLVDVRNDRVRDNASGVRAFAVPDDVQCRVRHALQHDSATMYSLEQVCKGLFVVTNALSDDVAVQLAAQTLVRHCEPSVARCNLEHDLLQKERSNKQSEILSSSKSHTMNDDTNVKASGTESNGNDNNTNDNKDDDDDDDGARRRVRQRIAHLFTRAYIENDKAAAILLKKRRWATLGWQYNWTKRSYDEQLAFPVSLARLASPLQRIAVELMQSSSSSSHSTSNNSGSTKNTCDELRQRWAAIANFYPVSPISTLCAHADDVEESLDLPLVAVSLGCAAVLLVGTAQRAEGARIALVLRHADIVVMSAAARLAYHAMPRVIAGSYGGGGEALCGEAEASSASLPLWLNEASNVEHAATAAAAAAAADDNDGAEERTPLINARTLRATREFLKSNRINLSVRIV